MRTTFSAARAIFVHNPDAQGAPLEAGDPGGVRINPLRNGAEYCDGGWHVISLGIYDYLIFYPSTQDILDSLDESSVTFMLDGSLVAVERTAITNFTDAPQDELNGLVGRAYAFNVGAILAPGALSLGVHELLTTVVFAGFPPTTLTTTFSVVSC